MALETGTYISDLVVANPLSSDPKSAGDDHIRLIKSTVKATFPNITGAVTVTQSDLNGVTGKASKTGDIYTGTQDFTGANITVPTQSVGDSSTKAASTAFVAATAMSAALPAQTGNSGKFVTTNGSTASWSAAGIVTAPIAGGALPANAVSGFIANASYTMPDLTTTAGSFGLAALTNAVSVPSTVATSDGWSVTTNFSAGTLAEIAPLSLATAHGMWGGKTMIPPTLATISSSGTLTLMGSVQMPNSIQVVVFYNATNLYAVAIDTVNNTAGTPVSLGASNGTYVTVFQDTSTSVVVGFSQSGNGAIIALSLSGTTLTAGSVAMFGNNNLRLPVVQMQAGSYLGIGNATAGSSGQAAGAYGITVSGTTCTVGTVLANPLGSGAYGLGLQRVSNTTALLAGSGPSAAFTSTGVVLTVSGTTVTAGSIATGTAAFNSPGTGGVVPFGDGANFLLYGQDKTTSTTGDFVNLSVSGTTVSFGTNLAITNNVPSNYTPVTYVYSPGQQIFTFDTTNIGFGNLAAGPYIITRSGTTLSQGSTQLSGQTAGTFYQDFAKTTLFYQGSSAFDRFTYATSALTSQEQVAATPTGFWTASVTNKTNKYSGTWYAWTVTLTMPMATNKALTISGTNLLLQGAIS